MSPRAAARLSQMGFPEVYEYRAGKSDWIAAGLPAEGTSADGARAADFARTDVPLSAPDQRVGEVDASDGVAVVVDQDRVVLGLLRGKQLAGDPDARVEDVMLTGPSTFRPHVAAREVADFMAEHDLESSPITTSDGRLIGVLFRDDVERSS